MDKKELDGCKKTDPFFAGSCERSFGCSLERLTNWQRSQLIFFHVELGQVIGPEINGNILTRCRIFLRLKLSYFSRSLFWTVFKNYKRQGTWSQSYDRDLQRQRCKFLQRHG
jgi:hypothetical protein